MSKEITGVVGSGWYHLFFYPGVWTISTDVYWLKRNHDKILDTIKQKFGFLSQDTF